MGYLICSKCKGYYKLVPDERVKDFTNQCECGGKLRYVENLDIIDPQWKPLKIAKKKTKKEIITSKLKSVFTLPRLNIKNRFAQFNSNLKNRIYNTRNQRRINRNPYGIDAGLINSIMNELNFQNIRWIIVIPLIIIVTLILAYLSG
ncbi:MAG: MFS transporter, partial [Methanobacterium sp.]|nr:MFS transporter [Methanobacterium sp.]